MKTPPLLLFATLLFWGWQSDQWLHGALAGVVLEAARIFKWRWELEDVDFNRLWTLCVLGVVALAGYVFTNNESGAGFAGMFDVGGLRKATDSSTAATTSVFRWLPLLFFPFVAAQIYNLRPTVPLTAISLVLRLRRRRGEKSLAGHYMDISYPYFMVCLFAAGIHTNHGTYSYFWGQASLILWALWTMRSRRFGGGFWAAGLAAVIVIVLGFLGQVGIDRLDRMVQNFNAHWLARFLHSTTDPLQNFTAMGQIGELKLSARIILRLQPEKTGLAPNYLREASYRVYQSANQSWRAGPSAKDFFNVYPQPDNTTWILLSNKVGAATVKISCYLNGRSPEGDHQGVLPLPSGCCRLLHLPATASVIALQTNQNGVVLAIGSGLMVFDARYGPGATMDALPDLSTNLANDLGVPTNEIPALDHVLAELSLTNASDAGKRLAIQTFFAQKFTYSTWQGAEKRGSSTNSPLTRFLVSSRSGHCEYFATATVLLLRQLGIPARYAVGYAVHETSGSGFVVRERDAHAWCLVWNRETRIWEDLDTTPASWMAIEGRNASLLDTFSDLRSWLVFQFERFRWRQTDLRKYLAWTITPVIAVLLYYLVFQRGARTRTKGRKPAAEAAVLWPGLDSAFYRLERPLAARGLERRTQEPLSDWLERALLDPGLAGLRPPLQALLRLHYRYRFDPLGLDEVEKKTLTQNAEAIIAALVQKQAAS